MNTVTSADGTSIAYSKTGAGPALILVDGAMCSRKFGPLPKLATLLAEHFTVIHYDRRGRGQSTDNRPYTSEREVEDIEALINACGGSAYVFGMSSGAILSLMVLNAGLPVEKLALYEPPVDMGVHDDSSKHYHKVKDLIAADNRNGAAKYFLKTVVSMPSFMVTIMSWLPMWKKIKANASSLPYDLAIKNEYKLQNVAQISAKVPVLILGGGKSSETLQTAARAVAERLVHGNLQILENQSHNVSTKVLAPVLINFFNE